MKISFCTWIYNRLWQYCQCLPKNLERAAGFDTEFILLDNGSTDGLYDYLESSKQLELIKYHLEALPFHNSLLKNQSQIRSTGDIIVTLDADNVIGVNFCKHILKIMEENMVYHCWTGDWEDGTCGRLCYTRSTFTKLGGYDEELLPLGCDDLDLRDRARAMGMKIVTEKLHNVIGYGIPNTREQAERNFGVSWHKSNSANAVASQRRIAAGKLAANNGKVK